MTQQFSRLAPILSLALLAACSQQRAPTAEPADSNVASAATGTAASDGNASRPEAADNGAVADPAPTATPAKLLTLDGLGELVVGKAVPAGSSFASRGAQIPGSTCKTLSSPGYPGVYALAENGVVRRITVGGSSDVKLDEGIGTGSTEAAVLQAFPGFRATPHKYVAAPAKYLTQPGNDPRLRFEIGADRKVSLIHVGLMPQLAYVEGCA